MDETFLEQLVYDSSHLLTNCNASYSETSKIIEHKYIPWWDVSQDDKQIVLHLKKALDYILNYNGQLSLFLYHKINQLVAYDAKDPGYFAYEPMKINGVKWNPPLPSKKRANYLIKYYTHLHIPYIQRAIELMLEFDRYQFFWDGNKRTSCLVSNFYLIQHGAGLINISPKKKSIWNKLLFDFYNNGDLEPITNWTLQHGIITHY